MILTVRHMCVRFKEAPRRAFYATIAPYTTYRAHSSRPIVYRICVRCLVRKIGYIALFFEIIGQMSAPCTWWH
jgi:hypothetical protein